MANGNPQFVTPEPKNPDIGHRQLKIAFWRFSVSFSVFAENDSLDAVNTFFQFRVELLFYSHSNGLGISLVSLS